MSEIWSQSLSEASGDFSHSFLQGKGTINVWKGSKSEHCRLAKVSNPAGWSGAWTTQLHLWNEGSPSALAFRHPHSGAERLGKQINNVSAVCALALYQRGSQPSLEFILSWPIVNNNPATASFSIFFSISLLQIKGGWMAWIKLEFSSWKAELSLQSYSSTDIPLQLGSPSCSLRGE